MPKEKKNKWDFILKDKKQRYLKEVIGYFESERNEEIGVIAAESVLDFFLETIGEDIYRKGLADVRKIIDEKLDDLEVELDILLGK